MARLMNIGFGNAVNTDKVVAVVNPDAAPIKRMVQQAKENGRVIDATQGRRTKSVLGSYSIVCVAARHSDKAVFECCNYRDEGGRR